MERERLNNTILLAEDDPQDVFIVQRAFKAAKLGKHLEVARDGEEAIRYLSGDGVFSDRKLYPFPYLLLMDLKMPKKSGLEVLEWMQTQPFSQELLTAILTSSSDIPLVEQAYALGARSFLVKPIGPLELRETIQRMDLCNRAA